MSPEQPEESDQLDLPEAPTEGAPDPSFRSQLSARFLQTWLGVNVLGFAIAPTLLFSIGPLLDGELNFREEYFAGYVVGVVLGPLQAIALQPRLPRLKIWQWILASILGGYLGVLLGSVALAFIIFGLDWSSPWFELLSLAIGGAIVGLSVGLCQMAVLARQVHGLGRWLGASVLGRSLGWLSARLLWQLLGAKPLMNNVGDGIGNVAVWEILLCGAVGGLIYGGVTAVALPNLTLRQRSVTDPSA